MSNAVKIGNVTIGGGAPVAVQSMLNAPSDEIAANVAQAVRLQAAGCEILRVAVPDRAAVALVPAIKSAVEIPLVADIHFDYKLALACVEAGVDKIRLNPGNIGGEDRVRAVVDACKQRGVPIRVGVNSGSVERDLLAAHGGPTAQAMVDSALRHVALIEKYDYNRIVISIKSSNLKTMIASYRLARERTEYPLHLGVTEAGTYHMGLLKSAVGIGSLLCDGIGDTIRVSLTGDPEPEIAAARDILKACGLGSPGVEIISCPTCGRTSIDLIAIADAVQAGTRDIRKPLKVAIMGCAVNGPGEAREADIGIAGGGGEAVLFRGGEIVRKLRGDIAAQLIEEIHKF